MSFRPGQAKGPNVRSAGGATPSTFSRIYEIKDWDTLVSFCATTDVLATGIWVGTAPIIMAPDGGTIVINGTRKSIISDVNLQFVLSGTLNITGPGTLLIFSSITGFGSGGPSPILNVSGSLFVRKLDVLPGIPVNVTGTFMAQSGNVYALPASVSQDWWDDANPSKALGEFRIIKTQSDLQVFLAESANLVGFLDRDITISSDVTMSIVNRKKLYFGAILLAPNVDWTINVTSGDGVLYFYSTVLAVANNTSINGNVAAYNSVFIKRIQSIGGTVDFSINGFSTNATYLPRYEFLQDTITITGDAIQDWWDDTSGDTRVSADSSDLFPKALVDKLVDGGNNPFSVVVVADNRKVQIRALPNGFYLVSSQVELQNVLNLAAPMVKHIWAVPPFESGSEITITGNIVFGRNCHFYGSGWVFHGVNATSQYGSATVFFHCVPSFTDGLTMGPNLSFTLGKVLFFGALTRDPSADFRYEYADGLIITNGTIARYENSALPNSNGLIAFPTTQGVSARTIVADVNSGLSVNNGNGISGNPTINSSLFTLTKKGMVPPPVAADGKFLRDDGTWQTAGGGGATLGQIQTMPFSDMTSSTALTSLSSNAYYTRSVTHCTGTIARLGVYVQTGGTGTLSLSLYDTLGTTLLAQADIINPVTGINEVVLGTPIVYGFESAWLGVNNKSGAGATFNLFSKTVYNSTGEVSREGYLGSSDFTAAIPSAGANIGFILWARG